MAVPKRKTTPSKRGMRTSHDALVRNNIVEDKETGSMKRSHHISPDGRYKGRQVIRLKAVSSEMDNEENS